MTTFCPEASRPQMDNHLDNSLLYMTLGGYLLFLIPIVNHEDRLQNSSRQIWKYMETYLVIKKARSTDLMFGFDQAIDGILDPL